MDCDTHCYSTRHGHRGTAKGSAYKCKNLGRTYIEDRMRLRFFYSHCFTTQRASYLGPFVQCDQVLPFEAINKPLDLSFSCKPKECVGLSLMLLVFSALLSWRKVSIAEWVGRKCVLRGRLMPLYPNTLRIYLWSWVLNPPYPFELLHTCLAIAAARLSSIECRMKARRSEIRDS